MAKKKRKDKDTKLKNQRIVLRTGEALVEAEPGWSAAEPEVVIGELDGPVGYAIANLIGDQVKGHTKVFAILNSDVQVRPTTLMVSKVTVKSGKYTNILMGTCQAAIAHAVLDAVRAGDIPKRKVNDLGIIVSVWLDPSVLEAEIERLLAHPRSQRFVEDFLGQWLKLRQIAANDPDKKLYPEFSPYLQDSMVAETRAYFRELIEKNLHAGYLVKSDFAMINEKLAVHYGIPGVTGTSIRRVALPPDCPRGGFLTQAAILKITANGTTTSPAPRGSIDPDRKSVV